MRGVASPWQCMQHTGGQGSSPFMNRGEVGESLCSKCPITRCPCYTAITESKMKEYLIIVLLLCIGLWVILDASWGHRVMKQSSCEKAFMEMRQRFPKDKG